MVEAYCRECDDTTPMRAGPTAGDVTCRRCGTVYEHRAYSLLGGGF